MRPIRFLLPIVLAAVTTMGAAPASKPAAAAPDFYALSPDAFFKRPEVKERIRQDAVNIGLLEAAIFQQSNVERAANKLPLFKQSWALNLMARRHSAEMSDLQFFDHVSPAPANRTMEERMKNVGLDRVILGENIAVLPARQMGSGRYTIRDNPDGSETWTDQATGKRIDYFAYDELAKAVVSQWMNSPPHRANMLRKEFLYLGVGVARGPYDQMKQDSFYMTQNFSSGIVGEAETKAKAGVLPRAGAATRP